MTREELKEHCKKQIEMCEMWAKAKGENPCGKVYEEHKLILELLEQQPCEDCISRQAVLEYIEGSEAELGHSSENELVCQYFKELPPVTPKAEQTKWILVSERLPGIYEEVIVTDIETSDTYVSRMLGNGYWECDNGLFKNRIIAWMPLPKPYNEESEVEE